MTTISVRSGNIEVAIDARIGPYVVDALLGSGQLPDGVSVEVKTGGVDLNAAIKRLAESVTTPARATTHNRFGWGIIRHAVKSVLDATSVEHATSVERTTSCASWRLKTSCCVWRPAMNEMNSAILERLRDAINDGVISPAEFDALAARWVSVSQSIVPLRVLTRVTRDDSDGRTESLQLVVVVAPALAEPMLRLLRTSGLLFRTHDGVGVAVVGVVDDEALSSLVSGVKRLIPPSWRGRDERFGLYVMSDSDRDRLIDANYRRVPKSVRQSTTETARWARGGRKEFNSHLRSLEAVDSAEPHAQWLFDSCGMTVTPVDDPAFGLESGFRVNIERGKKKIHDDSCYVAPEDNHEHTLCFATDPLGFLRQPASPVALSAGNKVSAVLCGMVGSLIGRPGSGNEARRPPPVLRALISACVVSGRPVYSAITSSGDTVGTAVPVFGGVSRTWTDKLRAAPDSAFGVYLTAFAHKSHVESLSKYRMTDIYVPYNGDNGDLYLKIRGLVPTFVRDYPIRMAVGGEVVGVDGVLVGPLAASSFYFTETGAVSRMASSFAPPVSDQNRTGAHWQELGSHGSSFPRLAPWGRAASHHSELTVGIELELACRLYGSRQICSAAALSSLREILGVQNSVFVENDGSLELGIGVEFVFSWTTLDGWQRVGADITKSLRRAHFVGDEIAAGPYGLHVNIADVSPSVADATYYMLAASDAYRDMYLAVSHRSPNHFTRMPAPLRSSLDGAEYPTRYEQAAAARSAAIRNYGRHMAIEYRTLPSSGLGLASFRLPRATTSPSRLLSAIEFSHATVAYCVLAVRRGAEPRFEDFVTFCVERRNVYPILHAFIDDHIRTRGAVSRPA